MLRLYKGNRLRSSAVIARVIQTATPRATRTSRLTHPAIIKVKKTINERTVLLMKPGEPSTTIAMGISRGLKPATALVTNASSLIHRCLLDLNDAALPVQPLTTQPL